MCQTQFIESIEKWDERTQLVIACSDDISVTSFSKIRSSCVVKKKVCCTWPLPYCDEIPSGLLWPEHNRWGSVFWSEEEWRVSDQARLPLMARVSTVCHWAINKQGPGVSRSKPLTSGPVWLFWQPSERYLANILQFQPSAWAGFILSPSKIVAEW